MTVLITGATGNVGSAVVAAWESDELLRLGLRSLYEIEQSEHELVHFDFEDETTFDAALTGVRALFLVRPPAISDVDGVMVPFIEAAVTHGVEHIVFLSLQGVENNRFVPHHKIEARIREANIAWTFLRAGFFMQNLSTTHQKEIREHDQIVVPAGDSRTAFIDVRDIGAVATVTLSEEGHRDKAYELTGSEGLTYHEVAAVLSDVLARAITYEEPSVFRFAAFQRRIYGTAWSYIAVMTMLYTITRFGNAAHVSDDVTRLLGRPPISFRTFVEDHEGCWVSRPL